MATRKFMVFKTQTYCVEIPTQNLPDPASVPVCDPQFDELYEKLEEKINEAVSEKETTSLPDGYGPIFDWYEVDENGNEVFRS